MALERHKLPLVDNLPQNLLDRDVFTPFRDKIYGWSILSKPTVNVHRSTKFST